MSDSTHPHTHTHRHSHAHEHDDILEANRNHFNNDDYMIVHDDHPAHLEVQTMIGTAVREAYAFDRDSTTVMDFACGTGLSTRSFAPYVQSVVGVDISQRMLDQYNKQSIAQGLTDRMTSVCAELKGADGELNGAKFDLVTCFMAYHHFSSVENITRMLVGFLKPGGTLLVVDNEAVVSVDERMASTDHVPHKTGFGVNDMKRLFEEAGLHSFDMKHIGHPKLPNGFEGDIFLAKGVKSM